MTPVAKKVVARDLAESHRDLEEATISVKNASARSKKLSEIDQDLLARSRSKIANLRVRLKRSDGGSLRPDPIDRQMLERHLQQARRHVAIGRDHVSRQRERVAQLERDGHDATDARRLLEQFEELQGMHIAHRDRLARQLGDEA
jgi:hypothetical protein